MSRRGAFVSSGHAHGRRPHHQLGPEAGSLRDQSREYPRGREGGSRPRGRGWVRPPPFAVPQLPDPSGHSRGESQPCWAVRGSVHAAAPKSWPEHMLTGVCHASETPFLDLHSFQKAC